jgi:hypothetical protein
VSSSLAGLQLSARLTTLTAAEHTPLSPCHSHVLHAHTHRYEARIRSLSGLEKIYEYFATHTSEAGHKVMSAQDVVRALVPTYPPTGSDVERAGFLDGG